jgi:hypothetical protein
MKQGHVCHAQGATAYHQITVSSMTKSPTVPRGRGGLHDTIDTDGGLPQEMVLKAD